MFLLLYKQLSNISEYVGFFLLKTDFQTRKFRLISETIQYAVFEFNRKFVKWTVQNLVWSTSNSKLLFQIPFIVHKVKTLMIIPIIPSDSIFFHPTLYHFHANYPFFIWILCLMSNVSLLFWIFVCIFNTTRVVSLTPL